MTNRTTDIQAFINEHPFSKYQWMILVLCFVTVAMDGFDTAIIGFIASDLVQEWGVEKSALGPVMSAALVGLAVGALTAGPMADRIGRKKVLIMSILVFGGFSLASDYRLNPYAFHVDGVGGAGCSGGPAVLRAERGDRTLIQWIGIYVATYEAERLSRCIPLERVMELVETMVAEPDLWRA